MKNFKQVIKGSVIALACAGIMGNAQAGALATSTLTMSNFQLLHSNGTVYSNTDLSGLVANSSANITATYNGVSPPAGSYGPTPLPNNDLNPVCAGSCSTITNNSLFTNPPLTAPISGNFVAADQNEQNSPIAGLGTPVGANVQSAAIANLSGQSLGPNTASSTNQLSSTWQFTLAQADSMTFSFDTSIYQESYLSPDAQFPSSAKTSSQFNFTITDLRTNAILFSFSDSSLNGQTSRNAPYVGTTLLPGETLGNPLTQTWLVSSSILPVGDILQLDGTLKTTAAAIFVPEPGALALMGIGLLGLVVGSRKSFRKS